MYSSHEAGIPSEVKLIFLLSFTVFLALRYLLGKNIKSLTGDDVAKCLGLSFRSDRTKHIEPKLKVIDRLQYGSKYHAQNVFTGRFKGYSFTAFDFRYEVEIVGGKSDVEDPYCFYALYLPRRFDEITIYHEGLISKIKQLSGDNDIDFESYEFSRKFRVRSPNPKFAYAFCHTLMIEYLMQQPDLSVEIDREVLCLSFNHPLRFEEVENNLLRLVQIREMMPAYLFE